MTMGVLSPPPTTVQSWSINYESLSVLKQRWLLKQQFHSIITFSLQIMQICILSSLYHMHTNRPTYQCTTVRLFSEGVTKLFPKAFDRQNCLFIHPHGKRKPTPELHLSALNSESYISTFFQEKP